MTPKQIAKLEKQIAELSAINTEICKDLRNGAYKEYMPSITNATNDLFRVTNTLSIIYHTDFLKSASIKRKTKK